MNDIVQNNLSKWVNGLDPIDARINVYERIRDIAYAIIPPLHDPKRYTDILKLGRGSCIPKHLLLCDMYQRMGLEVLFSVFSFSWNQFEKLFTPRLIKRANKMPLGYHMACKVDINERLTLVDATWDLPLEKLGLPVNREWDGTGDTLLAVIPHGEEQIFHPSEVQLVQPNQINGKSLAFYNDFNSLLDKLRIT